MGDGDLGLGGLPLAQARGLKMRILRRVAALTLVAACGGFSATETTLIVAATSVLSATATPHVQEYLENARAVKASGDVQVITVSLVRLTADVHRLRMERGIAPTLLVSDGEVPAANEAPVRAWAQPIDGREVQPLASHLLDNSAGYPTDGGGFGRWRGPYMDKVSPDPWGHRYAVNIGVAERPGGHTIVVVSAGPNGVVETPFETVGVGTIGDDILGIVGRGR